MLFEPALVAAVNANATALNVLLAAEILQSVTVMLTCAKTNELEVPATTNGGCKTKMQNHKEVPPISNDLAIENELSLTKTSFLTGGGIADTL